MSNSTQDFWQAFLNSPHRIVPAPEKYTAWSFGNTAQMADDLGQLVLKSVKRATTSLAWIYEKFPEEKMPAVGDFSVVLDSAKNPICIIETINVTRCKYGEVDEAFARTEGEGDGSLAYWRDVHWRFFSAECKLIGREPSEEMPVICEIFRVVFPATSSEVSISD